MNFFNTIYFILVLFFFQTSYAQNQVLPEQRSFDWNSFGLKDTSTHSFNQVDLSDYPLDSTGQFNNDSLLEAIINNYVLLGAQGIILNFPSGTFLFNQSINLPNNVIVKGKGAGLTTLNFHLNSPDHALKVIGTDLPDTSALIQNAHRDSNVLIVADPSKFDVGDWVRIIQHDTDLVNNSWAHNTVGQITQITDLNNNELLINSSLRMSYDLARQPYIKKIDPANNVGIECLKISSLNEINQQVSNIKFSRAVNCWVSGIESNLCNFSHIDLEYCSNIEICKSYFHDAHNYGSGGKGYGVMLHFTTNECKVEDNIFKHLRHSMILQAGANGNVFAYNYSFDPFWTDVSFIIPSNSSGELVLHGNWPYANLFEQNIVDNIVIDNSHGANGPYNTFFRNRANGYGIFFSDATSPNQNLIGNEITNADLPSPFDLFIYNIQGNGHFLYANNNLGVIDPEDTDSLVDISYAYINKPEYIPSSNWGSIGVPSSLGEASIPALDRFHFNVIFGNSCGQDQTNINDTKNNKIIFYPNPFSDQIKIDNYGFGHLKIVIYDSYGRLVFQSKNIDELKSIKTNFWKNGIYIINVFQNHKLMSYKLLKIKNF